jgi:hypothetical protein
VLQVKPDEVVPEEPLVDLSAPWADAEDLGMRPRYVPEVGDPEIGTRRSQERRYEREVIVLDEHQGGIATNLLEDDLCEATIHLTVGIPVLHAKDGADICDVAKRPQRLIREAVVVALLLALAEPDTA